MSTGNIRIGNNRFDVVVHTDSIHVRGSVHSPQLTFNISLNVEPLSEGEAQISLGFNLVKYQLQLSEMKIQASTCVEVMNRQVNSKQDIYSQASFSIESNILSKVEQFRKGNLPISLQCEFQITLLEEIIQSVEYSKNKSYGILRTEIGVCNIFFEIPQSVWVNDLLPKLGHNSYKLIELPRHNNLIPEEYTKSIVELDEATKYFNNGDYDKAVAHCRSALDPLKSKLPSLKEFVTSKSEHEWANKVLDSTNQWLEQIIKNTASFTSKTHHAPSIGHFGRTDAEIVMMVTTAIIGYVGKLNYKENM